jgi:hypothetical protein
MKLKKLFMNMVIKMFVAKKLKTHLIYMLIKKILKKKLILMYQNIQIYTKIFLGFTT